MKGWWSLHPLTRGLLLLALVAGIAGFYAWVKSPAGRMSWDERKLRFPIAGKIILKSTLARFARSFALAARMVRSPESLDVVVASNLFADILTDLAAAIQGGMGMAASANTAPGTSEPGLFESVHGSAPDIAGKGAANPIAMIASFGMALRYSFGLGEWAEKLDQAIAAVLAKGTRTRDIAGGGAANASTSQMGAAILAELKALA